MPGRRLPFALAGARLTRRFGPAGALELAGAEPTGTFADLAAEPRTLIVSFRRDGTPVPTPVWAAVEGDRAYVRTERASGKVKRLRRDGHVLLAPCTARGRPLGPACRACGRVMPPDEEPLAERVLAGRYRFGREAFERAMDLLRVEMCYLDLRPVDDGASASGMG